MGHREVTDYVIVPFDTSSGGQKHKLYICGLFKNMRYNLTAN